MGLIGVFSGVIGFFTADNKDAFIFTAVGSGVYFIVPGFILFLISFKKRDSFEEGIKEIEKHFPAPIGFDGNVIDVLDGDKIIDLSDKPVSKFVLNTSKKEFQLLVDKHYSKIFNSKDLIDYEIRVDNEIVVTSSTNTKKGAGKAVAGGLLLGGAGAIAGAIAGNAKSTTTETQTEIHHYTLVLKVNDLLKPSFVIDLDSIQIAEDVAATLYILSDECNTNNSKKQLATESKTQESNLDKFEEIKKYKELLDEGIITKEEFEKKEKRIIRIIEALNNEKVRLILTFFLLIVAICFNNINLHAELSRLRWFFIVRCWI